MQPIVANISYETNPFTVAATVYAACITGTASSKVACSKLKQDIGYSLQGNAGKRAGGPARHPFRCVQHTVLHCMSAMLPGGVVVIAVHACLWS